MSDPAGSGDSRIAHSAHGDSSKRSASPKRAPPYDELGLGADHWDDGELLDQMLKFPILINRPIVVTPWGVKLCRPSETVLDILPLPQKGPFAKEDGEPLIDSEGKRVPTAS
jgi:arsenate reductase